jgi:hypothetical protein
MDPISLVMTAPASNSLASQVPVGLQRVLDDTERQRARARGMVADRKERTLIALDGRPSSSGPRPKQTVTRTLAAPQPAVPQGVH